MEIEKIFKNLIFADFIVIILMVISSMYQPSEISNLYENLNDGLLSNFENYIYHIDWIISELLIFTEFSHLLSKSLKSSLKIAPLFCACSK